MGGEGGEVATGGGVLEVLFLSEYWFFYACASDISVGAHNKKKQATLKHHKGNF